MIMNKWERLAVLSPAVSGELVAQTSLFDDCWGTVVDIDIALGEDEVEKRFYNQQIITVRIDNTDLEFTERASVPTDPETGELAKNEDGSYKRPARSSKIGVQETLYNNLGVPWEGSIANIMGIHSHWLRKGVRKTRDDIEAEKEARARGEKVVRDRNEVPYGRYLVEWDYYDNDVRKAQGLPPILVTAEKVGVVKAGSDKQLDQISSVKIEDLVDGKTFMELLKIVRTQYPDMQSQATRVNLTKIGRDGTLELVEGGKNGVIYNKVRGE